MGSFGLTCPASSRRKPAAGTGIRAAFPPRAWRGLLQVAQGHRGQTVCVVSHGSAMRCILCRAMGKPLEELGQVPWCENTGLNLLEFEEDGSVRVVCQNDASHLTPETASMAKQSWWQI